MSGGYVTADTDDPRVSKATTVHQTARAELAAIKSNNDLTERAKGEYSARVRAEANAKLAELQAEFQAAADARLDGLKRQVFTAAHPYNATSTDRIAIDASYRDALERAARTDPVSTELQELTQRAVLTGDKLLAKAAAAVGLERADIQSVDVYLGSSMVSEREAEAYSEYWAAINGDTSRALGNAFVFAPLS